MHCMPKIGGHEITSTHYTFYNAIIISLYQSSCNLVSKRLTRTECMYSKISIIRIMIIRISGLIQTLMNVSFLMYGVHMWLVN